MSIPVDSLHSLQQEFLAYLLEDSADAIARRIVSTPQRPAGQRLRFYGNAYRLRLREALQSDYERLHTYLGDELFESLVQQYIDRYPSCYTSLRQFGAQLPAMTRSLAPFAGWPEVAEIAQIEQAFADSFDAADADCVTLQQLHALPPEAWTGMRMEFHASVQLLPQRCNSFQIWQALVNDESPPEKIADAGTWVVWREDLVSRFRSLQPAELAALELAHGGGSFAELCVTLMQYFSEQETPQRALAYLQQWIHDQMVCALQV